MRSTKESDLLIISKVDLNKGEEDIKHKITHEWLKTNLNQGQALLAFVTDRNKRGPSCVSIKVDQEGLAAFIAKTENDS